MSEEESERRNGAGVESNGCGNGQRARRRGVEMAQRRGIGCRV